MAGIPQAARQDSLQVKEKKRGVSFLSRLSFGGKKNKDQDANSDDGSESDPTDLRTEGMNAEVFSRSVEEAGASGFIPVHKEPPRYIKVRAKGKKEREFGRVFLAQELKGSPNMSRRTMPRSRPASSAGSEKADSERRPSSSSAVTGGAIWTTEFSIDGKHLAAAGQDQVVRVWSVISTAAERAEQERDEDMGAGSERLSTPVFKSKPLREFTGHTSTVLDLSWSKNNFLLSSSIDKTVRLWHVSREECLCTFKHKDFVTSIAFHPRDDRFFLAGSLDGVLRLWSIPDKNVAFWAKAPEMITSVAFSPDGRTAISGGNGGLLGFYETEGLSFVTQVHVRSSRGKNSKGSKITGIRTMVFPPDDPNGEVKVLVSSNDSRIRLYNLRDKSLEMKFKGHENVHSQIRASFSEDGRYVVCGSEDRRTYIWSLFGEDGDSTSGRDKHPLESFASHADLVTTSIIAPTKTRQLLGQSGDPIFDLCNPPPVTLLSRAETRTDGGETPQLEPMTPTPTNAYLARARHEDGNIIITASHGGSIKIFRQDCAANKRRNDSWETSSMFKSKLGRQGSIMTRRSGSTGRQSRRNSVGMTMGLGLGLAGSRGSTNTLGSTAGGEHHHILNWAHGIHGNQSVDALHRHSALGLPGSASAQSIGTTTTISAGPSTAVSETTSRSERSVSPNRNGRNGTFAAGRRSFSSLNQPNVVVPKSKKGTAGEARQAPYKGAPPPMSPPQPGFTTNARTGSAGKDSMRTIGSGNGSLRTRTESTGSDAQKMAQMQAKAQVQKEIRDREQAKQEQITAKSRVQREIRERAAQNEAHNVANSGLKEPAPGALLPTPSFQIKTDEPKRSFWGLGGGKSRRGSGAQ